jgi:hypothetical protein
MLWHRDQKTYPSRRWWRGTCATPSRRFARLTIEILEDRTAPSAVKPTPPAAVTHPVLPGGLAILAANSTPIPARGTVAVVGISQAPPAGILLPSVVPFSLYANVKWSGGESDAGIRETPTLLALSDVPVDWTLSEGITATFTARASYGETQAQHAYFSLEPVPGQSFPDGAAINPETGEFSWRPPAGDYFFVVRVRDGENTAVQVVRVHVEKSLLKAVWPAQEWSGKDLGVVLAALPDKLLAAAYAPDPWGRDLPPADLTARSTAKPKHAFWLAALPVLVGLAVAAARQRATRSSAAAVNVGQAGTRR